MASRESRVRAISASSLYAGRLKEIRGQVSGSAGSDRRPGGSEQADEQRISHVRVHRQQRRAEQEQVCRRVDHWTLAR